MRWGFLFDWLRGERRSGTSHPAQWLVDWVNGGAATSAGVNVNAAGALKYTPFWAAVRIISGTLASLPFMVYERLEQGGKKRITDHPIHRLLHERPNDYMDAVTFLETRQAHVLTYGNGYAEIQRDRAGRPMALWPLLPDRTQRKLRPNGVPYYEVKTQIGETFELPDENVLHIKGLGFDGYTGYDVVSYHKEAIAYGIAVKQYGARFFGQGATPTGVLEYPNALGDKERENLQRSLKAHHEGLDNAHHLMILEEGMKWNQMGIEPAKAQAMDVQKYTVDDCSRIFQIPPHKLGSMEFSKYNNVEQLQIDFVTTTMLYWLRKWEQEVSYKLLMPSQRPRLFCEILIDGLLRGNVESRTAYYASGRQWGYLSINDIRDKENLNPIGPAGDMYLDPMNMAPAGSLQASQNEPANQPEEDHVRAAHRALLTIYWRRIITKYSNGNGQKDSAEGRSRLIAWATDLLSEPSIAYGATRAIPPAAASCRMVTFATRSLCQGPRLSEADAESLADALLEEIGGDHANSETKKE